MLVHMNSPKGDMTWGSVPFDSSLQARRCALLPNAREAACDLARVMDAQIGDVADELNKHGDKASAWIELPNGQKLRLTPME